MTASLYSKLNQFRHDGKFCDINIKIAEEAFPAHRVILAAASEYFETMFTRDVQYDKQENIALDTMGKTSCKVLLQYIYTGVMNIDANNCFELLVAGDFLRVNSIEALCINFLQDNHLQVRNIVDIFLFACKAEKKTLVNIVSCYIAKDFINLSQDDKFLEISYNNLTMILKHEYLCTQDGDLILDLILRWVKYDRDERYAMLYSLLKEIHFQNISPLYTRVLCKYMPNSNLHNKAEGLELHRLLESERLKSTPLLASAKPESTEKFSIMNDLFCTIFPDEQKPYSSAQPNSGSISTDNDFLSELFPEEPSSHLSSQASNFGSFPVDEFSSIFHPSTTAERINLGNNSKEQQQQILPQQQGYSTSCQWQSSPGLFQPSLASSTYSCEKAATQIPASMNRQNEPFYQNAMEPFPNFQPEFANQSQYQSPSNWNQGPNNVFTEDNVPHMNLNANRRTYNMDNDQNMGMCMDLGQNQNMSICSIQGGMQSQPQIPTHEGVHFSDIYSQAEAMHSAGNVSASRDPLSVMFDTYNVSLKGNKLDIPSPEKRNISPSMNDLHIFTYIKNFDDSSGVTQIYTINKTGCRPRQRIPHSASMKFNSQHVSFGIDLYSLFCCKPYFKKRQFEFWSWRGNASKKTLLKAPPVNANVSYQMCCVPNKIFLYSNNSISTYTCVIDEWTPLPVEGINGLCEESRLITMDNNCICLVGSGSNENEGGIYNADISMHDMRTGKWQLFRDEPGQGTYKYECACTHDGKIYTYGHSTDANTAIMKQYDPSAGKWTVLKDDVNQNFKNCPKMISYKNNIWIIGGAGKRSIKIYDLKNDTWSSTNWFSNAVEKSKVKSATVNDAIVFTFTDYKKNNLCLA